MILYEGDSGSDMLAGDDRTFLRGSRGRP